ncbi:metal ABC transporter substrate-binding protein [Brevibacillus ginsengisoli]|uniref:metal ABC transporter substrate-binding protein n=1 Tax=Brevibacillus ginsengisoli TaxID=363854 RepID=UPI003CF4F55A
MKRLFPVMVSILVALSTVMLTACGNTATTSGQSASNGSQKLVVYTSFYPLYFVASRIGGDEVEVKNVVPPGVEPHDFEPTTNDIVEMSKASLVVYSGTSFDAWVDKAISTFDTSKMKVVKTTEGLPLLSSPVHEGDTTGEEHNQDGLDPHVWLDPTLLKAEAKKVEDALIQADQAHQAIYQQNFDKLSKDLDQLDQEFAAMVSKSPRKEFMVSHAAFGYLAHRYGLEQVAISGINPSDEPSPARMKELIDRVNAHHIKTIFFETLASPKISEVIAKETGAHTATLNPLEGLTEEQQKAGIDYLSVMRENLTALQSALQE